MSTDVVAQAPDLEALRSGGVMVLDEPSGKEILRSAGLEVPQGFVVTSSRAAVEAVEGMGLPCVVKIVAQDLPHKSDIGGVVGPLRSAGEVEIAVEQMLASAPASVTGVLVEPWIAGVAELFVGLSMDTSYGPVLVVGLGGVWVEEFGDVAYRLAPVDGYEALQMIRSRRAARQLVGKHGTSAVDLEQIAAAIAKFSQLALHPQVREHVREIEINPLIARADGAPTAVDCTVVLKDLPADAGPHNTKARS